MDINDISLLRTAKSVSHNRCLVLFAQALVAVLDIRGNSFIRIIAASCTLMSLARVIFIVMELQFNFIFFLFMPSFYF